MKLKYKTIHQENKIQMEKLKILELQNVQTLDFSKLKQLENFFYKALDITKDLKFLQKYSQSSSAVNPPSASSEKLWKTLDIPSQPEIAESGSEDSSLEFESSFYKSKKNIEVSIDLNESSILP